MSDYETIKKIVDLEREVQDIREVLVDVCKEVFGEEDNETEIQKTVGQKVKEA